MIWKQFFRPVTSINWDQADRLMVDKGGESVIFLDVRQPVEYQKGHRPGATLIPVGELDSRLSELDKDKHIVIY